MKFILVLSLLFLSAQASYSDAVDINKDLLVLQQGNTVWFKVEIIEGIIWHADSNDPDLLFNEPQGNVSGKYQYFQVGCKRSCKSGETYSFFLTETRVGNLQGGEPLAILAYVLYIS